MMRNSLLATTAIVGASMLGVAAAEASDPPELRLDGFLRFEAKFIDQDVTVGRARAIHFESDDAGFNMNADATADNGLKYGLKIEIDTDAAQAGVDELRIRFSGDWGILDLGDDDGAEDSMAYGGENMMTAGGGYDGGAASSFNNLGVRGFGPNLGEGGGDSGDASKITYYTPRVSGVQLGVSYTPDTGNNLASNISASDTQDLVHHVGVGLNYVEKFGDVDFRLHGITGFGQVDDDLNDTIEDGHGYMVGLGLGWMGWKLGLGYGDGGDGLQTKAGNQTNPEWISTGLGYTTGPYTFGAGYLHSSARRANELLDTTNFWAVMAQYTVAPGLIAYAEVDYIDVNSAASTITSTDGLGTIQDDNDAVVFQVGTRVTF